MQENFEKIDGFLKHILYDFAGPDDIENAKNTIDDLKNIWIKRPVPGGNGIIFHTIGAATYLDKNEIYHQYRTEYAGIMHKKFAGLYQKLCKWLGQLSGYEVCIAPDLSPPGFHIYQGNPHVPPSILTGGNVHLDLPHYNHKFPSKILGTLSFTLPIILPQNGGGCYYWTTLPENFVYGNAVNLELDNMRQWFDNNKKYLQYDIGKMVLHNGQTYHQLANASRSDYSDWRITLQGHGVLLEDKTIYLYF